MNAVTAGCKAGKAIRPSQAISNRQDPDLEIDSAGRLGIAVETLTVERTAKGPVSPDDCCVFAESALRPLKYPPDTSNQYLASLGTLRPTMDDTAFTSPTSSSDELPGPISTTITTDNQREMSQDREGEDDTSAGGKKRAPKAAKRRKVNHACLYCRRSHMTCDEGRPCQRW